MKTSFYTGRGQFPNEPELGIRIVQKGEVEKIFLTYGVPGKNQFLHNYLKKYGIFYDCERKKIVFAVGSLIREYLLT